MTKTISAGLEAHLAETVTTLATCWLITRTDGQVFRFTTHTRDVTADFGIGEGVQTYLASTGYRRTAIQNDSELNVNNLSVQGVFDNDAIKEVELRRGLFDFADVRIFFFNYEDTSQGVIKMLRGFFGEARSRPDGSFEVELRSMEQALTKTFAEFYSKDCRADLGDVRCRAPIASAVLSRDQTVNVGQFFRVRTDPAPDKFECRALILPFDGADAATSTTDFSKFGNTINFIGNAQLDTAQSVFGGSSLLLDGTGDYLTSPDRVEWTPKANEPFTIHARVRTTAIGANQMILSHYTATGNNRSWFFYVASTGVLAFSYSLNGTSVTTIGSTGTLLANTWYHVAVTRDAAGNIRLFIDGSPDGSGTETGAFFNAATVLRVGARDSGGITDFFNGWIDELEYVRGDALWTGSFTPPSSGLTTVNPDDALTFLSDVYEDRIYEVTTAGQVAPCQPTYDTTVGNTTTDGTAVLTARQSFTRYAVVSAVDGAEPRRKFTVTQLTPNTQFPNDHFNFGAVTFETGNNIGRAMEVRDFIADDGITIEQDIELFLPMPFDIEVGDELRIFPGCDKRLSTCRDKFDNVINFVGEPHVPGADYLRTYPDAR